MPVVSGQITTNAPSNVYPTHDSRLGLGGVHDVADIAARNAITADRRRAGMLSFVASESRFYKLEDNLTTWTPWADATSFVFDTRDALAAYAIAATGSATLPGIVYIRSYHGSTGPNANPAGYTARYPGIGARFWQYHPGNTLPTDGRAIIPVGAAGAAGPGSPAGSLGRYLPVFENGRVDVTAFGARPARATNSATSITFTDNFATETNAAFQAAEAYAQNQNTPDFVLWAPEGIYQVTQTLEPESQAKKFHLEGIGRTVGYPPDNNDAFPSEWAWFNGGTTICQMNSGTPIIRIRGNDGSINGVNLTYATEQTNTSTNSVAILGAGTHMKWDIRNVGVFFTGYTVHVPADSGNSVNCTWDNIYTMRARAGCIRIEESGTTNRWSNIYCQSVINDRRQFGAMSKISDVGTEFQVTVTNATGLPSGVQQGSMVTFFFASGSESSQSNVGSYNGKKFFIKSITPAPEVSSGSWVLKFDHTSATNHSGAAPTVGSIIFTESVPYAVSPTGRNNVQVYLGGGYESDWQAMDLEICNPPAVEGAAIFLENHGKTTIGHLHCEYGQARANNQELIQNGGFLDIGVWSVNNIGIKSGYTLFGITNQNPISAIQATARIGVLNLRDIADVGGVFTVARSVGISSKVHVGAYGTDFTNRANAKSAWGVGDAVSSPAVLLNSQNASVAGTGLFEVVSGSLQTPKSFIQHATDNRAALQGVLGVGSTGSDEFGMGLTNTGQWGAEDNYTTFKEACTYAVFKVLRDITDLTIAFPGFSQAGAFYTPTEAHFKTRSITGVSVAGVRTITNATVSGSGPYTVTLTFSAAHGLTSYTVGKTVTVSGLDTALNGAQVITAVPSTTTVQFQLVADPGALVDVSGTGTGPYLATLTFAAAPDLNSFVAGKQVITSGLTSSFNTTTVITSIPSSTTATIEFNTDPGSPVDVTGTLTYNTVDPYEVLCSVCEVSGSDYTTEIGPRTHLRWGDRYWYLVKPGTQVPCDPVRRIFLAGSFIRLINYTNCKVSTGTTIVTEGVAETGQIAVESATFPRTANYGVNTKSAVLGVSFNSGAAIDPGTFNKVSSGTSVINAQTACLPSLTRCRFIDAGAGASTFPAIGAFVDSIGRGAGDLGRFDEAEGSGRGYLHRTFSHLRPLYNAGIGGNGVQYWVDTFRYNWEKRAAGLRDCNVFYTALGINDVNNGRSVAQIKADLINLWALQRKLKTGAKIISGSITYRWISTDAYLTTDNQSVPPGVASDHNTKVVELNAWLKTQVGAVGGTDGHVDFDPYVCAPGGSFKFRTSELVYDLIVGTGSTQSSIVLDSSTLLDSGVNLRDYCAYLPAAAETRKHRAISINTTSTITVGGFAVAPTAGQVVKIVKAWTVDDVHPTGWGHNHMANAMLADIAKFTR